MKAAVKNDIFLTKGSRIKKSVSDRVFDIVNLSLVVLLTVVIVYPLYFTIIASFSDPYEVVGGNVVFFPKGLTLEAYDYIIEDSRIWLGYRNTFFYTIFGTLFSLALTITGAFALSRKELPWRKFFVVFFLVPMYFSGGLIPSYLLVKDLNLVNSPLVLIILGGVSIYNLIVTRSYFQSSIPEEIYESARIDGANELRCFWSIALPLAKPIIAVIALYYGVGRWNSYFDALLYTSKTSLQPLQIVLRSILLLNENALTALDLEGLDEEMLVALARRNYVAQAMKYALIMISSLPLLIAYPFVQKFFVKGVMIGSIKG